MSRQPTPQVTPEDVTRILKRDFAPTELAAATALLERYGGEDCQRETDRVRLAVLKLAAGDLRRLATEVESACGDYRDVLAPAEFPRYLDHDGKFPDDALRREVIDADWQEYQSWLKA